MILYFFSAPSLPGLCVSVYTLSIYSLLFLLFTLRREEFGVAGPVSKITLYSLLTLDSLVRLRD